MKQRLVSALVVIIILIPPLIVGGIYFKTVLSIISIMAIHEVIKLRDNIPLFIRILSYVLVCTMITLDISIIVKILITVFSFMILLPFFDRNNYNVEDATYIISFIILIGLVFYYVCTIRVNDINVLIYLLIISILTDTVAYIIGKPFGKHKIIEKVSKEKSVEGTVSGVLAGTIIPSIFYIYFINPGANIGLTLLMTFILSVIGQVGDWVFSSIKRHYDIKDFSNIMPGHGGILDRFDSTIFIVVAYIIIINLI